LENANHGRHDHNNENVDAVLPSFKKPPEETTLSEFLLEVDKQMQFEVECTETALFNPMDCNFEQVRERINIIQGLSLLTRGIAEFYERNAVCECEDCNDVG